MKSAFSEPLQQIGRTYVLWRGRKLTYFGGCDYLRLSSHPKITKAVREGIAKFGLNVAASRRTTGNHPLYEELEHASQKFFGAERALLVSNGYLANIAAAQGLAGELDHVFIDDRAHSSLRDALKFLSCPQTDFSHRDADDLRRKIRANGRDGRIAVFTDGMFAHDGWLAPLSAYRDALGPNGLLWVDDAHGAGILGRRGRGSLELARISRANTIQTITFSKAFGSYGGAVLCDRPTAETIVTKSCVLGGNTPLPLPYANAALAGLTLVRETPALREKLQTNVLRFWNAFGHVPGELVPIIPVTTSHAEKLKRELLQAGIHPPFIRYSGGPPEGYFRFAICSEHTPAQIDALAEVLANRRSAESRAGKCATLFSGRES
jgi:7-keto-8-aminopelargonate synthetase-like enzyme